jgi:hypothetical protein
MMKTLASAWPYFLAILLACLVSFPTWSLLKLFGLADSARWMLTVAGFGLISSSLMIYMRCCMRRHLPHGHRTSS